VKMLLDRFADIIGYTIDISYCVFPHIVYNSIYQTLHPGYMVLTVSYILAVDERVR